MKIEATGHEILDALEWGARTVPEENGAFLHVSGITYEIHTYIKSSCTMDDNGMFTGVSGEYRVKNVMIGGEPLDLEKTYTVGGLSYPLMDKGDGQTAFAGTNILWESDQLDYTYVVKFIRDELGGVISDGYDHPYGQERIVAVESKP
jgi:2',3'-cyclic-nucleotide 2'-phosphodiesterase (5'-nucleotidase family)